MSSSTHDDHDSPDDHGNDDNGNEHGTTASDAELIEAARTGDTTAYGTLFGRHEHALRRMAECMLGRTAEDLVLFAYTHGFDVLRGGGGPTTAIRPFLLRAMIRHCADADHPGPPDTTENQAVDDLYEQTNLAYRLVARNTYPVSTAAVDQNGEPDHEQERERAALDAAVNAAVVTMYEDMADDWRLVVWHGEVDQDGPETLGLLLGIRAEDAYVLRHRARQTMRQFALSQYLASARPGRCRYAVDRLDPYDRAELDPFEAERVAGHLNECAECAMLYEQLRAIAARLPEIVARGTLGEHTEAYLARPTKRSRGTGWAAVRLARLRSALTHRGRRQALGAAGLASTVLLAMVGGVLIFQPDITLRPTPALDSTPWTPWDLPVGKTTYEQDQPDSPRARTGPSDSGGAERGGLLQPDGTADGDQTGPSGSRPPDSPDRPSKPSDPSDPTDPSDPSDPPGPPSPSDPPTTSPTTPPPSDEPSDPPTDDPTDGPSDPPTDGPSDPPTDDPTTPPPSDDPSPTSSPSPSFLPA